MLSKPTRLAIVCIPRSFALLRVAPIAAATARLVAQLFASPSCRVLVFASQRALFTDTAPNSPATETSAVVVAPKGAAELRVLSVLGVVDFVKNELKIDSDDYEKLVKQKIDGAALLETSVDELCDRCGLSAGAAHAIIRGIAPAVTEVQAAAVLAAIEAQSVTLTIFPPTDKKKSNPYKMTLTPDLFQ